MTTESDGSSYSGYFGTIGMIDWTNPAAATYWHNLKRQPNIINNGVIGHWLDLNEPEVLNGSDYFNGFDPHIGLNPAGLHGEADVHNMFAFYDILGLYNGYQSRLNHHG
jgi:alpha-glucosidase